MQTEAIGSVISLVEHFDVSCRPGVPARCKVGKPARWVDCVVTGQSEEGGIVFVDVKAENGEFHQLGLSPEEVKTLDRIM